MTTRPASPSMTLAALRFDRSAAITDGKIRLNNVVVVNTPGGRTGVQGLLSGSFDAAEVPLVRYVFWKAQGLPFTAVPIFSDRLFQFQYMFTRTDTNINSLEDMRGRNVMCAPGYYSTPSFWYRALLKEEAGIEPHEIHWHSPFPEAEKEMRIPEGVQVTHSPASILGLERLLDGTVDCLVTARTPMVPSADRGRVRRILSDAYQRQKEWYQRTGFFPILHVLAVRNQAMQARPSFGEELCQAYDEAKEYMYRILQDDRMTGLPFMRGYLDDTVELCGDDPWPYGLERNRAELDRFLGYAQEQGLTNQRLSVDELFDARSASYQFKARMVPGCITSTSDGGWAPEGTGPA